MTIAATTDLLATWVGAEYGDGDCWDPFVRDAFKQIVGVDLPESYYESVRLFDTVHSHRRPRAGFVPQPWDVVMLRTHDFLILHCAITLDAERFIQPWDDCGLVICRFDDDKWSKRIAGFLRLKQDATETE